MVLVGLLCGQVVRRLAVCDKRAAYQVVPFDRRAKTDIWSVELSLRSHRWQYDKPIGLVAELPLQPRDFYGLQIRIVDVVKAHVSPVKAFPDFDHQTFSLSHDMPLPG